MPKMPHQIFRAYDIRGKVGTELTEYVCLSVGHAFGSELSERYSLPHPRVILGRDARTHSPALEEAVRKGLELAGCEVLRIGEVPSPVNYFGVCHFQADGSIQVTASHNAAEDNGLKLQLRNAEAFSGESLQGLRMRIEEERFLTGEGSSKTLDVLEPYMKRMTELVRIEKGMKIVIDTGNGVAGPTYAEAMRRAGIDVIGLYLEPDGTFPNHIADPSQHHTLNVLQETVRKEKAACGIAFDGDGDRVGFVDEEGRIVSPDYILLLLAEDHLTRFPGAPIIYTVSMSSILETEIRRLGGKPIMCSVGHSFVEHTMRQEGSRLGGEQSGHFFCGEDFYDHDDALVAALRILSIFSQKRNPKKPRKPKIPTNRSSLDSLDSLPARPTAGSDGDSLESFSHLFSQYPKVFQTPEWRPHTPDDKKGEIIQKITTHFAKKYPCNTLDGVRIDFGDGAWAGIRQSNTSPKISVCMEARSKEKLQEVETLVKEHLRIYPDIGV